MLKTLLACLLASLVASPTLPPGMILVGMTEAQVEAILGKPRGEAGFHVGPNSNAGITSRSCSYDSISVHFSYGRVSSVKYK